MRRRAPGAARPRQRGVTLVELVATIVIIGTAVAGVVGGFSLVVGRSADTLVQARTSAVGQAYLDYILTLDFGNVDSCERTDERPKRIYVSTGCSGTGNLDGYDGYSVDVEVEEAGTELGLSKEDAKRIDVTVKTPQGSKRVFTAYKGKG